MTYTAFFKRLFPYIKPHIVKITITIIAVILASLLTSALPEITGRIIDDLFNNNSQSDAVIFYALILLGVIVLSAIFTLIHTASNVWISNQVVFDIRQHLFNKILYLPKSYFDQHTAGSTLSKITFDVEQISNAASIIWVNFIKSLVMSIALISYLIYKSWQLSLLLIILMPIIAWSVRVSAKKMRTSSQIVQQSIGQLTHQLNENISANTLVKLYHAYQQEKNKFYQLIKNIRQQRFRVDMIAGLNTLIASIGIGISLSLVVYLSSTHLNLSAGEFLAFFTAMTILIKPIKQLININKPLQLALVGAQSVFHLLDLKNEKETGKLKINKTKGHLTFKSVNFSYSNQTPVLKNINFNIQAGKTTAIVGKTGSGKSTLIQLLCRFYQVNSGEIQLDSKDISQYTLNSYRQQIALVDQSVQLFNGTVAENIYFGQNELSDDDMQKIAKLAHADEFIKKLPDGFNTQIGENGIQLSGGQRQRLSIARAIAKQAPILIFDEATSALDTETEKQVQNAINKMHYQKTLIIIAHRLSTIEHADNIVILDSGQVIGQGTHQELINHHPYYQKLHTQFD